MGIILSEDMNTIYGYCDYFIVFWMDSEQQMLLLWPLCFYSLEKVANMTRHEEAVGPAL